MIKKIASWLVMGFMVCTTALAVSIPVEDTVLVTPVISNNVTVSKLPINEPVVFSIDENELLERRNAIEIVKLTTSEPIITESPVPTAISTPFITEEPQAVVQEEIKMEVTPEPIPVETEVVTTQGQITTGFSEEDVQLIALLTMAEAEGEPEYGKRLVIDTVLNRVESDKFPNTVSGVVYDPGEFTSMSNGRASRCYVDEYICQLVREEIESRSNYDVLYFRAGYYHSFGTPVTSVGNHYFSTY